MIITWHVSHAMTGKQGMPQDPTALAATKGQGGDDGGIDVTTSSPSSLSNPINIKSGSKAGGGGLGLGRK
jgi:hypothetical protein